MIPIAQNCAVYVVCWLQEPHLSYRLWGHVSWACKTPRRNLEIFTFVCSGTQIHLCYFKNGRNWCRICVQNTALSWWQKKNNTSWRCLAEPLRHCPSFFMRVRIVVARLYFWFGGVIMEKPFCNPPKWMQYRLFKPTININEICIWYQVSYWCYDSGSFDTAWWSSEIPVRRKCWVCSAADICGYTCYVRGSSVPVVW